MRKNLVESNTELEGLRHAKQELEKYAVFTELHDSVKTSLLANFRVERCRTDDLMPNVPISCLPPSRVDLEVQGLSQVVLGRPRGLLQSAGGLSAVMGKFNSRGLLLMLKNKFLCAVSR